ncbi:MAG TPA: hypothetical protein VD695_06490 [Gaiellaceae bacterium]|nr:hypothetical protein [Gaiellaceae bacterium]
MATAVEPTDSTAIRRGQSLVSHGLLGLGLVGLAAGLAADSLLGPLAAETFEFPITETLRNQMIGLDAVSLLVVAPLAVVAGVLALRGRVLGQALALGIGAYTAYMFVQYALGPQFGELPGDSQALFPLYLVLFALGWIVALGAWNGIDPGRLPSDRRRDLAVGRFVLPVLAFLAFFRYLPALADATSASPQDEGYLAGPTFFWAIALMDLGILLPATVAACYGLVRGAAWGQKALYLVAGWFGLVGPAVAGMAIAMYVNDDPVASGVNVVVMTVLGALFAALAVAVYLPLLRR